MPNAKFTNEWISSTAKILFRGAAPPDPLKFYVGLANTDTLTRTNTLTDFIEAELLLVDGYSRKRLLFGDDGIYNTVTNRHEMPIVTVAWTVENSSIQFQTVFLLADGHPVANTPFTSANVSPTSGRIIINDHPWIAGDRLLFSADTTASLPAGITAGTIYQVISPTTNDFAIALVGSSYPINLQDTGSGNFNARAANGIVAAFMVEPAPITILAGQTYSYQIPITQLNTGYVAGI